MPKTFLHSWLTTKRAIIIIALILSAILLFIPLHAKAQEAKKNWDISSFKTDIIIDEKGTVTSTESIVADFTNAAHHGILRSIPALANQRFSLISINDENGKPMQYTKNYDAPFLTLKIGDPNKFVNEPITYIIRYKYEKVLNQNRDNVELLAHLTGDDWDIPINNASAIITLPDSINMDEVETSCKTHYSKIPTTPTCKISIENHQIEVNSLKTLSPGEELSATITLPKDSIPPPSTTQELLWIISDTYKSTLKYLIHEVIF